MTFRLKSVFSVEGCQLRIPGRRFAVDRLSGFEAVPPDITISESFGLNDYDMAGKLTYTPAHTAVSVSIVLAGKGAVVGNLMTDFPVFGRVFPPFADDIPSLL